MNKQIEEMYRDIPSDLEIDSKDILTILEILAEKDYRKQYDCSQCKYAETHCNHFPCSHCSNCYINKFEQKGTN